MTPFEAWVRYHVDTERFDRTLPGRWSAYCQNTWVPQEPWRGQSSRYALKRAGLLTPECRRDVRSKLEAVHAVERLFRPGMSTTQALQAILGISDPSG